MSHNWSVGLFLSASMSILFPRVVRKALMPSWSVLRNCRIFRGGLRMRCAERLACTSTMSWSEIPGRGDTESTRLLLLVRKRSTSRKSNHLVKGVVGYRVEEACFFGHCIMSGHS